MKKHNLLLSALAVFAIATTSVNAADLYVSIETGKNKGDNAGTKEAPYKNLFKAIASAKAGDTIHVAKGVYQGKAKQGWFPVNEPVSIIGGYSTDFSSRDPVNNPTVLQPTNDHNRDQGTGMGILAYTLDNKQGFDVVVDGLTIDEGHSNTYHPNKGKPEGFTLGMLVPQGPAKGNTIDTPTKEAEQPSRERALLHVRATYSDGNFTVKNCVFANGDNFAIQGSFPKGNFRVLNNVFVNNRMMGVSIFGAKADQYGKPTANVANLEVANNTMLFTWSRTKELEDMGYGVRCEAKFNCNFHHNIFGLTIMSAVDMSKGDDKTKHLKLDNNVFFLNRQGDFSYTVSPSVKYIRYADFEDVEDDYDSMEGNINLTDPNTFGSKINNNYLKNFLSVSYTEKTDFNPNSPVNQFRSALGMNQVGRIESNVSMYANHYPVEEMYQLFGAMPTYGAQNIK